MVQLRGVAVISAKNHKRNRCKAPISNRQTRKVANPKVRNRFTKPNLYNDRPTHNLAVTNFGVCGFWRYRIAHLRAIPKSHFMFWIHF